jgi:hypothetical protein
VDEGTRKHGNKEGTCAHLGKRVYEERQEGEGKGREKEVGGAGGMAREY